MNSKMKVMISLLGGRPLPNVQSILKLNPDRLYIIASKDSCTQNGSYSQLSSMLPDRLKYSECYSVDPYKFKDTSDKCKEIFEKHHTDQIIVVSASEPKTMSFGAYDAVKDFREQGKDIDMCYSSREGLIWIFYENKRDEFRISLKDYFNSYGWDVELKSTPDSRLEKLASLLVEKLPDSHKLLHILRDDDNKGKRKGKRTNKSKLEDKLFNILLEIEKIGLVSSLQYRDSETEWTINTDADGDILLKGHWLEFYVYQVASQANQDKPLFDECGWGIKDIHDKGEIDFAGITKGQIIIASCKTENSIERKWFEELHSKMEQLGKGMCSGLMISSVSKASRNEKDIEKYNKWAKERQIVFVMAEDLPRLPDILRKVVTGDDNDALKDIPYYPRI